MWRKLLRMGSLCLINKYVLNANMQALRNFSLDLCILDIFFLPPSLYYMLPQAAYIRNCWHWCIQFIETTSLSYNIFRSWCYIFDLISKVYCGHSNSFIQNISIFTLYWAKQYEFTSNRKAHFQITLLPREFSAFRVTEKMIPLSWTKKNKKTEQMKYKFSFLVQ